MWNQVSTDEQVNRNRVIAKWIGQPESSVDFRTDHGGMLLLKHLSTQRADPSCAITVGR